MAQYTMRTVAVIKRQVILASPTNMTEMTKALHTVNADLEKRGITYTDDAVTIEACDDSIVLWYDISDNLDPEDIIQLQNAMRKTAQTRAAERATKMTLDRLAPERKPASAPKQESLPIEPPVPEGDLPELTKSAAVEAVKTTGTTYFHLPSEQREISMLRSRVRTAARNEKQHVLVEIKVVRKPRPALEVTVVR